MRIDKIIFRAIAYFCMLERICATDTWKKLDKHFRSFHWSDETVRNWQHEMKCEVDIFPKKSKAGRKNDDKLEEEIREQLNQKPSISASKLASKLKKARSIIQHYLYDVIGVERVRAFSIPHELTEKLRMQRKNYAMVQAAILRAAKEVGYRIISTGDESWFKYSYFSLWFYLPKGSQRPQVVRDHRASRKIMLIIFFNGDGPLLVEALEHNQTITSERMEKVILPKLHNAYQEYYNKLPPEQQKAMNDAAKKALQAGMDEIRKLKLPLAPLPPEWTSRHTSDQLFLSRTSLFPDDDENCDDYHEEQAEEECIIISDDSEDEDESKDRKTKRQCNKKLEELAKEDREFRRRLKAQDREYKRKQTAKGSKRTKGKPISADEQISLLAFLSIGLCLLHMDNASPHNTDEIRVFLSKTGFIRMPHPPNSPDLAPCDFYLFSHIKSALEEEETDDRETLLAAVNKILPTIPAETWRKVFDDWLMRLEWVIAHDGEYYPAHLKEAKQDSTHSAEEGPTSSASPPSTPASVHSTLGSEAPNPLTPATHPSPNPSPTSSHHTDLLQLQGIVCMKNLGNTCYLNSLLQCLFSIIPFSTFFLAHSRQLLPLPESKPPSTPSIVKIMRDIFNTQYIDNGFMEEKVSYADPRLPPQQIISTYIPRISPLALRAYIPSLHHDFTGGWQADQHQLFQDLMQDMERDIAFYSQSFSFKNSLRVATAAVTHCTCGSSYIGAGEESISLQLPLKRASCVKEAFRSFFAPRVFKEEKYMYQCSVCHRKTHATQRPLITHLPEVLVIFLQYTKAPRLFQIDQELHFTEFNDSIICDSHDHLFYDLIALSFFIDYGHDCGHYVTIRYLEQYSHWFVFDDLQVTSWSHLGSCISAVQMNYGGKGKPYLLFYKRHSLQWTVPSPPSDHTHSPLDTPTKPPSQKTNPFASVIIPPERLANPKASPFHTPVLYDSKLLREALETLPAKRKAPNYTCSICGRCYSASWSLHRHLKIHSGDRFKCGECGRLFTRKDNLQTHIDAHHRIRCIPCLKCSYKAYSSRDLYYHNQTAHMEESSPASFSFPLPEKNPSPE